jgi:hypothetical protein
VLFLWLFKKPTPRPLDISLEHLSNPSSTRQSRPSVIDHSDEPSDDDDSHHHLQQQQQQQQQQRQRQDQPRRSSRSSRGGSSSSRSARHGLPQPDILPPQYAPIDPYKCSSFPFFLFLLAFTHFVNSFFGCGIDAAGVAEVMLSEQFHGSTSHHSFPVNNPLSGNQSSHPSHRSNSRS